MTGNRVQICTSEGCSFVAVADRLHYQISNRDQGEPQINGMTVKQRCQRARSIVCAWDLYREVHVTLKSFSIMV